MANNTFKKEYLAVVTGKLDVTSGTINKPIARKPGSIIERCISENGKPSVTHFEVLKEFDTLKLSFLEIKVPFKIFILLTFVSVLLLAVNS